MNREKFELEMKIKKAEAAKMELQFKIYKLQDDIERIQNHIGLQDESIAELIEKLKALG